MSDASDSTSTETSTETNPETSSAKPEVTDWEAEVEKWKKESRKWEERAKGNSKAVKELDDLKRTSMTDQEKAVADAVAKAQADWNRDSGKRLAAAEIRALSAGRLDDARLGALMSGISLENFLTEDYEPDVKAINSFLDGIAPKSTNLDLGQGARGNGNGGAIPLNSDELTQKVMDALNIPR